MPPLLRLTSNTATPKGWLRKSGEEISIFLLPPLQSMLDSWCSLESTQYRRWFSKSWGGKGPGGQVVSLGWQPGSLLLCAPPPRPHLQARPQKEAHPGTHQETGTDTKRGCRNETHGAPGGGQHPGLQQPPLPPQGRQGSPRVIPLGHSILSATSVCRSAPLSPDFSILAW